MGIRSLTTPVPFLCTVVLLTFFALVLHPALDTFLPHPRFTFHDHGPDSTSLGSLSFFWPSSSAPPLPPSVRFAEKYNQGEWVPRAKPITSWEEMEEVLPGAGLRRGTCRDFDGGIGDGRMFHVASQVWVGAKGGRTDWDARAMVVDLLQRRGGLFLVGDSITSQHFEGLSHLLFGLSFSERKRLNIDASDPTWNQPLFQGRNITEANIPQTIGLDLPWFRGMFLRLQHPLAKILLEEAGVDEERALLPIATIVRDDFLMSRDEYEGYLERNEFSLEEGVDFATTEWIRYIERVTKGSSSKPMVLILSTGPHWANGRFSGAGQTEELKPERLVWMFERSIKSLFKRLEPIREATIPIFRTTAQGHPSCWLYSKEGSHPANATELLTIQKSFFPPPGEPTKFIYNWAHIPTFNSILQDEFEFFNQHQRNENRREAIWMDIADQALLRPDVHLSPMAGDCLHVCMPGLPEEWARFTWELIKAVAQVP